MAICMNISRISGTKHITPPTPSMMPEVIMDFSTPSAMLASTRLRSHANSDSTHCMGISPTVNVMRYMRYMMASMMSGPKI